MDIKSIVAEWTANKGPFGSISWCDHDDCVDQAERYVTCGRITVFLCKVHHKEFTHEIAYPKGDR